jgi:hypothetical protein
MALTAGTRVGPYEVTALIGEGGMGKVWRARNVRVESGLVGQSCGLPVNLLGSSVV